MRDHLLEIYVNLRLAIKTNTLVSAHYFDVIAEVPYVRPAQSLHNDYVSSRAVHLRDGGLETQAHHIERFELSVERNQDTSTQMTTHIEITKDRSVC